MIFKGDKKVGSSQQTVDFILECIGNSTLSYKKMFGEYALYTEGKMVALICDNQLFVKKIAEGEAFLSAHFSLEPNKIPEGFPYQGAKAHFLIGGENWENGELMRALIHLYAKYLPLPTIKKKVPKKDS